MKDISLIGLNHKTASVELRERCRVEDFGSALAELRGFGAESVVLSTCNRFEIYAHGLRDPEQLKDWIANRAGVDRSEIESHAYLRFGANACKHLFFVTSSLDSLVVGETQIRGQVKEAYRVAQEAGSVGPALHRLFQAALRVSKEISESTGVGRGNVSVAGAAADLAERVFGALDGASVLVIGAGETAELVMNHLVSRGVSSFHVANRTAERARELAERFQANWSGLDDLGGLLTQADVLVGAIAGDKPVVGARELGKAVRKRRGRPVVAIDISVPRCIDPKADSVDNVYRFDMDALTDVTRDALRHRRKEFLQCCTLIDGATLRLAAERKAQQAGEAISRLEGRWREVADQEMRELERRMPGLGEAERDQIRRAIHRIVRKLMHSPVRALRQGEPKESEVIRRALGSDEP